VKRGSEAYAAMKKDAADDLYRALERVIPDIRQRVEVEMTRVNLYGAALPPGPKTGIEGLYAVGDSTYPGIGVPAAAGSGFFTANSIVSVWKNLGMLYGPKIGKNV
jgi:phytoene dehydrogenase-like protein